MKKFIKSITITLLATLLFVVPTFAAKPIDLYIDDWKVPTTSHVPGYPEFPNIYYLEVPPQTKNGRTYVPISTITKFSGAEILWQNPQINIEYKDIKLDLTIGKTQAIKNGNPVTLDAPPYIYKNRTMVPLRFVSEQLGLGASHKNQAVYITTPTLTINSVEAPAIQSEFWMTMGSKVSENRNNLCINRTYEIFTSPTNEKITKPDNYGKMLNVDVDDYYYLITGITFMNANDDILAKYMIYQHLSIGQPSESNYIIEDVQNDQWYQFSSEKYENISDLWEIGEWKVISNTIV